jgi:hypothetical protein
LGLATSLAGFPLTIAFALAAGRTGFVVGYVVWWLLMDFALTFVTPALAYTTHSVLEAFRIGRRMIVETWPTSKWYVVTPGLATTALFWARPTGTIGTWVAVGMGTATGLLALWFKGAIASYYLRRHNETGYWGAAFRDIDDDEWRWTDDD